MSRDRGSGGTTGFLLLCSVDDCVKSVAREVFLCIAHCESRFLYICSLESSVSSRIDSDHSISRLRVRPGSGWRTTWEGIRCNKLMYFVHILHDMA